MIRSNEILIYLEAIVGSIANELRPDLRSASGRRNADNLIRVLDRLVAYFRDGNRIALENLESWRQLRLELDDKWGEGGPTVENSDSLGDSRERLACELDLIQRHLLDENVFSFLTDALGRNSVQALWLREAITVSANMMEAIEDSVRPPQATVFVGDIASEGENIRPSLDAYLSRKFLELPENPIRDFRLAAGGTSKLTALFSVPPNTILPERLVLRLDMAMSVTTATVPAEYPIVDRLHKLGLRVPKPILLETDPKFLGSAFMITEEVIDSVPAGVYFPKERSYEPRVVGPQFAREAASELARLHILTATGNDDVAFAVTHRERTEVAHRKWKAMAKPAGSIMFDLGFAWLKANPLPADRPRSLIHGDYGLHNMMVRDGHLASVIDWELAEEGDPAEDLAECRMLMVEDLIPWDDFVEAYLAAGGDPRACDPKAVAYYCVWMFVVKFGVMTAEARNYFMTGARTDSALAWAAGHAMDRLHQYVSRALKMSID